MPAACPGRALRQGSTAAARVQGRRRRLRRSRQRADFGCFFGPPNSLSAERGARIQQLSAAVRGGTYDVSGAAIAGAIVGEAPTGGAESGGSARIGGRFCGWRIASGMGGLLSSLNTASTALSVFSKALAVDEANVANASSPGYAAQRATIVPVDTSGDGASRGDFVSLSSSANPFLDAAVQAASSQAFASQTTATQLSPVNQLFDITGTSGILAALEQFSTAFSNLSANPNDPTLGSAALSAAGNVAAAFQSTAQSLDGQRTQTDAAIQSTTSQINALAAQIRQLNVAASGETQTDPETDAGLRNALDGLSSLVDINVTHNADGTVNVLAGGQLPLVVGDQAYTLTADPSAAPGSQLSSSAGGHSPASFSGQLGALLEARSGAYDSAAGRGFRFRSRRTEYAGSGVCRTRQRAALFRRYGFGRGGRPALQLFFDTPRASGASRQVSKKKLSDACRARSRNAGRVNALLSSGVTASGAAGVLLFSFSSTPGDAALTLAVDPSVTPAQLGLGTPASGTAAGQSNGVANQLAALAQSTAPADQIDGQSASGLFSSIAALVGQKLSDANSASTADQTALTAAQTNRQQTIGVSLNTEAAAITGYQQAYEANSQVVAILNQISEDAINIISPTAG